MKKFNILFKFLKHKTEFKFSTLLLTLSQLIGIISSFRICIFSKDRVTIAIGILCFLLVLSIIALEYCDFVLDDDDIIVSKAIQTTTKKFKKDQKKTISQLTKNQEIELLEKYIELLEDSLINAKDNLEKLKKEKNNNNGK